MRVTCIYVRMRVYNKFLSRLRLFYFLLLLLPCISFWKKISCKVQHSYTYNVVHTQLLKTFKNRHRHAADLCAQTLQHKKKSKAAHIIIIVVVKKHNSVLLQSSNNFLKRTKTWSNEWCSIKKEIHWTLVLLCMLLLLLLLVTVCNVWLSAEIIILQLLYVEY